MDAAPIALPSSLRSATGSQRPPRSRRRGESPRAGSLVRSRRRRAQPGRDRQARALRSEHAASASARLMNRPRSNGLLEAAGSIRASSRDGRHLDAASRLQTSLADDRRPLLHGSPARFIRCRGPLTLAQLRPGGEILDTASPALADSGQPSASPTTAARRLDALVGSELGGALQDRSSPSARSVCRAVKAERGPG